MQTVLSVFLLLGGIALFLFGINFMSVHLQQAADNKLRVTLEKMTGNGLAALLGMLNSCASGVSVVNIDNGFGAGYLASMINHM